MAFTNHSNISSVIGEVEKHRRHVEVVTEFTPPDIFVTGHTRYVLENIIDVGLSSIVSYVGIVSNILVLCVFYKQGYGDSTNVSMSAIAVWDLIKCLSSAIHRVYAPLSLASKPMSVSWANISTATLIYLVTFSNYVSSALAAYVAVERCLCVTMPFKVRSLLTPKTTFKFMLTLSVIVFGSFFPIFFIYDITWIDSSKYNTTIAIYSYSSFFQRHHVPLMKYYNLIGIIYPTTSFFVIILSTTIIIARLKDSSKFRAENTGTQNQSDKSQSDYSSGLTSRDKQVIKMLLVIIAVYVIALFPRIILYLAKFLEPELYFLKKYHNIFLTVCYVIFFLDFCNATVNLYIFLAMSSNFYATFRTLFCLHANRDNGAVK